MKPSGKNDNQVKLQIIKAAMFCFSKNGYRKASVNDIAVKAKVSKALIFHYFLSKKELYMFTYEHCAKLIKDEINARIDPSETDFFEKYKAIQNAKLDTITRYSDLFGFLHSANTESDKEVSDDLFILKNNYAHKQFYNSFTNIDYSKFRDGLPADKIIKIVMWTTEGLINELTAIENYDLQYVEKEFNSNLEFLKKLFYKGEN